MIYLVLGSLVLAEPLLAPDAIEQFATSEVFSHDVCVDVIL
jgi:hypothetical protein